MVTVDFTDTDNIEEGGDFEPVDEGIYEAEVFEASMTESNGDPARPGLNVQFRITSDKAENRRVFRTFWLPLSNEQGTEKAGFMVQFLKDFINSVNPEIDTIGEVNLDPADLIGKPCRIEINHEEYKGETQENVEDVKVPTPEQTEGDKPDFLPDES